MDEKPTTLTTGIQKEQPASGRPKLTVIDGGAIGIVPNDSVGWPEWYRAATGSSTNVSGDLKAGEAACHGDPGAAIREPCVICGEDVEQPYVSMDWGPGREAICGRACAERLLDALDAFLRRQ